MEDYRKYHQLENYLINEVGKKFREFGKITEEDFYLIIIWKSNRSKSKTYNRLIKISSNNHVEKIASEIYLATSDKGRMAVLINKWKFSLPIASAILAILYPDTFTIYDARVRNALGITTEIKTKVFDKKWIQYQEYTTMVKRGTPSNLSLRDKDRYLWGKSLITDLKVDLRLGFPSK